jgi:hypothetical protein
MQHKYCTKANIVGIYYWLHIWPQLATNQVPTRSYVTIDMEHPLQAAEHVPPLDGP